MATLDSSLVRNGLDLSGTLSDVSLSSILVFAIFSWFSLQ